MSAAEEEQTMLRAQLAASTQKVAAAQVRPEEYEPDHAVSWR